MESSGDPPFGWLYWTSLRPSRRAHPPGFKWMRWDEQVIDRAGARAQYYLELHQKNVRNKIKHCFKTPFFVYFTLLLPCMVSLLFKFAPNQPDNAMLINIMNSIIGPRKQDMLITSH